MAQALEALRNKTMGYTTAVKTFKVPRTTLRRRFKNEQGSIKGYLGGHKPTFDVDVEAEIAKHVVNLETRLFGLTGTELRKLVFQIAEKHKINHRFNKEKGIAGRKWLKGFLARNPQITVRTPEQTSIARAEAFNKENIRKFFSSIGEVMDKYQFSPENIYNVDETGMGTVPTKPPKVLATKGRKQIGIISSAERGQNYTAVCCMNAIGTFVPPAFIFPRKRFKAELMDDAPVRSVAFCQDKGWMTTEIFVKWLKHFVLHVKPSNQNKVLLTLDGHSSHKGLEVLEYSKANGIILFCLPPHCSHRVQPLDVGVYAPLQTFYNAEIQKWMRVNPGRTVTHFQVAKLFNNAYLKAATPSNAINSFTKTGIYPFNPDVFQDWEFSAASTTDKELENIAEESQLINSNSKEKPQNEIEDPILNESQLVSNNSITTILDNSQGNENDHIPSTSKHYIRREQIEELSPLPKATIIKEKKRKRGKTGVINSTPNIEEIKETKKEVLERERRKTANAARRKIDKLKEDSPEEVMYDQNDSDESDTACLYCNELYSRSRPNEFWLKCQNCNSWCHSECAGVPRSTKTFICDVCQPDKHF